MEAGYEEYRKVRPLSAWLTVACLCLFILGVGFLTWKLVPERGEEAGLPRQWNLGSLPDVPGQSKYSSGPTPPLQIENAPRQYPMLPEAEKRK